MGAPKGNRNAEKHGAYSQAEEPPEPDDLDAIIDDLKRRHRQVSDYIDAHFADLDPDQYTRLCDLQGKLASRIGRLERDRAQAQGGSGEEGLDELYRALSDLHGIDLTGEGYAPAPNPGDDA